MAALAVLAIHQVGLTSTPNLAEPRPVQAAEREHGRVGRTVQTITSPNDTASLRATVRTPTVEAAAQPILAASASVEPDLSAPPASPASSLIWRGTAGRDGNIRSGPNRSAAQIGQLKPGDPVTVARWVSGDEVETENDTWADLGNGRYVYSALLRSQPPAEAPARPANAPQSGRWIDVNLTLQVATAYDGPTPLKSVLVSSGRPGWETPLGTFKIQRRVPKETMDGATLAGQGPGGRGASYKVENVHWTQYFTADGSAIHENYWRNPAIFGIPGSHGCVGMLPADAAWFWDFATIGTPVVIH